MYAQVRYYKFDTKALIHVTTETKFRDKLVLSLQQSNR